MRFPIVFALVGAASFAVLGVADLRAAEIHKCAGPQGRIAYQTSPCESGQREVALLTIRSSARDGTVAVPTDPFPERSVNQEPFPDRSLKQNAARGQWLPFARRPIAPGMTDDEVLNSPSGGVPARIARSRAGRAWREVWTYAWNGESRELEFVNGRLASIGDASASSIQPASAGHAGTDGRALSSTEDRTATADAMRLAARRE